MQISREQYESDIRKAKAQALRDYAAECDAGERDGSTWAIRDAADELDPQ